ncbi:DUF2017 domain-containing protein [Dietzia timorensis]|uniref:Uncharacterized protein n=1 Tax=Dietzia timorensis TaxID=499555 RepID=A0A173LJ38_9ACTN|nr:DUF2017 domain-containing protein [Dietzia timorensis]ANI91913.1 Uncharacterized protein BJL86_1122 [Dietzia timorensis]
MDRAPRFARKSGIRGVKYKARLEPAEADLVRDVVSGVMKLLSDRLGSGSQDELAELTGIKSGNSEPPDYAPLARLIPDFFPPSGSPRARAADAERYAGHAESLPEDADNIDFSDDVAAAASESSDSAASQDDPAETERENAAMRMLHEPEIIEAKLFAGEMVMRTIPAKGGAISLNEQQAEAWLQALNDVRLVLGELIMRAEQPPASSDFGSNGSPKPGWYRTGVPEEMPDPDSPMFPSWQAYYWCAMMQDDLLQVMA